MTWREPTASCDQPKVTSIVFSISNTKGRQRLQRRPLHCVSPSCFLPWYQRSFPAASSPAGSGLCLAASALEAM